MVPPVYRYSALNHHLEVIMFSLDENAKTTEWQVKKIAVVGPGIVGVPMAALQIGRASCRERV